MRKQRRMPATSWSSPAARPESPERWAAMLRVAATAALIAAAAAREIVSPDSALAPAASESLHVSAAAAGQLPASAAADGTRSRPYRSLQDAKEHIIRQHFKVSAAP